MKRKLPGVLYGAREPIMHSLPQRVLHDLGRSDTESAQLWNRIYARATPRVEMGDLLALPQLWGPALDPVQDSLEPYYWGFNLAGQRLSQLDEALIEQDGEPAPMTEVDLFLLGSSELVLVEAKANSGLGRCGRYAHGRCPEIHSEVEADHEVDSGALSMLPGRAPQGQPISEGRRGPSVECRYWEVKPARFDQWLEFGARPTWSSAAPPCDRHYQLARTLVLGMNLAKRLERRLHLWLLLPDRRWPRLQPTWLDFADRVRSPEVWRRMRVISWEALSDLPV